MTQGQACPPVSPVTPPKARVILDTSLGSMSCPSTHSTPPSKVALIPVSIPHTQKKQWYQAPGIVTLLHFHPSLLSSFKERIITSIYAC